MIKITVYFILLFILKGEYAMKNDFTFIRENGEMLLLTKKYCFVSRKSLEEGMRMARSSSFVAGGLFACIAVFGAVGIANISRENLQK